MTQDYLPSTEINFILSTCEYSRENGRLAVIGKKIE